MHVLQQFPSFHYGFFPTLRMAVSVIQQYSRCHLHVNHAESWGGPLSLAVYVPAPQHTRAAQAGLQLIKQRAQAFIQTNPLQQLLVSVLFARHFAWEGVSALKGKHLLYPPTGIYACRVETTAGQGCTAATFIPLQQMLFMQSCAALQA
jgi:hypothetical protein